MFNTCRTFKQISLKSTEDAHGEAGNHSASQQLLLLNIISYSFKFVMFFFYFLCIASSFIEEKLWMVGVVRKTCLRSA
jgi:hypothetical protein